MAKTVKYSRGVTIKTKGGNGYEYTRIDVCMEDEVQGRSETFEKAFERVRQRVLTALINDIMQIENAGKQQLFEEPVASIQRRYNLY